MPRPFLQVALIVTCLLQVFCVFLQAVLAGSFLSGIDASVRMHEIGGWVTFSVAVLQVVLLALPAARRFGIWLLVSSVGNAAGELLQLGTGYGRFMGVHIPLAVLIVSGLVWQVTWIVRKQTPARA